MKQIVKTSTLVTLAAYCVPLAVLGCLLALNSGYSGIGIEFQSLKWSGVFWLSCAGLIAFGGLVIGTATFSKAPKTDLWIPLIATSMVILVIALLTEGALRIVTTDNPSGRQIGSMILKPFEWDSTRQHNKELFANSLQADAYFVGHPIVGWAIGSSRVSADGLYESSVEGLRSERAGDHLAAATFDSRIALYGDSFMFSEEVSYRDSLAFHMNAALGDQHQIVNFGVPGYGIDQAYLRFEDSADTWRPSVAILGFIRHDLVRALDVYTFLRPSWGIPFSKPRFELDDSENLKLNNVPNISPEEIFAADDIAELPFLELDPNYVAFDWQRQPVHGSMIFRTLASVFPRYPVEDSTVEERAVEIGARIAQKFVEHARYRGIVPIVTYLPSRSDFNGASLALKQATIFRAFELGVEILDMTDCLSASTEYDDLFVVDGVHYSGSGNQVFADCLIARLPENG